MPLFIMALISLALVLSPIGGERALAHEIKPPVHQHIAYQATKVWQDCPQEIKNYAPEAHIDPSNLCIQCLAGYTNGKSIIIGSGEEDKEFNPLPDWLIGYGCFPESTGQEICGNEMETEGRNGYMEHLWDPDYPNAGAYNNCNPQPAELTETGGYNKGFDTDIIVVDIPAKGYWDSNYRLA